MCASAIELWNSLKNVLRGCVNIFQFRKCAKKELLDYMKLPKKIVASTDDKILGIVWLSLYLLCNCEQQIVYLFLILYLELQSVRLTLSFALFLIEIYANSLEFESLCYAVLHFLKHNKLRIDNCIGSSKQKCQAKLQSQQISSLCASLYQLTDQLIIFYAADWLI